MFDAKNLTAREAALVTAYAADASREHVGDVYAKGLFGAAEKAGQTEAVLEELDSFLTDVLDRFPRLEHSWARCWSPSTTGP